MSIARAFPLLAVLAVGPMCEKPVPRPVESVAREPATAPRSTAASAKDATPTSVEPAGTPPSPMMQLARERVRQALEEASALPNHEVAGVRLLSPRAVTTFYEGRAFEPAWFDAAGLSLQVSSLMEAIAALEEDGLEPGNYHLEELRTTMGQVASRFAEDAKVLPQGVAGLDVLLTDAFLSAGAHLVRGTIDPETIHPSWTAARRTSDLIARLESGLKAGTIRDALLGLRPAQQGYAALRDALQRYREIAKVGGWPRIRPKAELSAGTRDRAVPSLRARLAATGDLADGATEGSTFDEALASAVRRFQARHGLSQTGIVDPETLVALNIPVERRIEKLVANLERWRWLPDDLGRRHVRVNIASFELAAFEDGNPVLMARVVVGKQYRQTPVFSDAISHIVLNPRWSVPHKLATRDILPAVQKDPGYLAKKGLRVFSLEGGVEREVDPKSIRWSEVSTRRFPYKLRQVSGPENALGRVKFMFPNKYGVYLHDTPKRGLFAWTERAKSSGCIRVERPLDLAELLLRPDPQWTKEQIERAIAQRVERTVWLPEPVPLHLLYCTTWVDADGVVHFRKDLYGRDRALGRALTEAPP